MSSDAALVLAWLILAHLVADFILQTDTMVADKSATPRRRRWRGLTAHGFTVAICLTPVAICFGQPGIWFAVSVSIAHVLIDRWKVRATRHAEADALNESRRRRAADEPETGLGTAWTPMPAALFAVDQVVHVCAIVGAWSLFLAGATPIEPFATAVDRLAGGWDRSLVHAATLSGVVALSLLIVNVRAGAFFVATLVRPREAVEGLAMPDEPSTGQPVRTGWRFRIGPLEAVAAPEVGRDERPPGSGSGGASPARIGATIGVLERLLIVTFVLTGSEPAIGFVVAAKTLARFRQLDDRGFAEYYLLGTLASVAVAVGSGILALAALRTLP